MENIKLMKTKAGKGFKLVVGDRWVYTSIKEMYKMLKDESNAVEFRSIKEPNSLGSD